MPFPSLPVSLSLSLLSIHCVQSHSHAFFRCILSLKCGETNVALYFPKSKEKDQKNNWGLSCNWFVLWYCWYFVSYHSNCMCVFSKQKSHVELCRIVLKVCFCFVNCLNPFRLLSWKSVCFLLKIDFEYPSIYSLPFISMLGYWWECNLI